MQRQLYEAFLNSELVHSSMQGSPLAAITVSITFKVFICADFVCFYMLSALFRPLCSFHFLIICHISCESALLSLVVLVMHIVMLFDILNLSEKGFMYTHWCTYVCFCFLYS